jgi:hypothetical protein
MMQTAEIICRMTVRIKPAAGRAGGPAAGRIMDIAIKAGNNSQIATF